MRQNKNNEFIHGSFCYLDIISIITVFVTWLPYMQQQLVGYEQLVTAYETPT